MQQIGTPSILHGIHGLAFGPDGGLYAGSVAGRAIYRLDPKTGAVASYVGAPRGGARDLAFGRDGNLAWTSPGEAAVFVRGRDRKITTVAQDIPRLQAVNFAKDGRLYFSAVAEGDGLYAADVNGTTPPRSIARNLGGLGAFQIDAGGTLYGPLMFRGKVVKINLKTGDVTDVAKDFAMPTAVRIAGDGKLIVLDHPTGEVIAVDPTTGDKTVLATLDAPVDNLAIAKDGTIFVSSAAFNGVTAIDPASHATRRIAWSDVSAPGGLTLVHSEKQDDLLVADIWGARTVDSKTGAAKLIKRGPGVVGANSIAVKDTTYILGNVWPDGTVQIVDRDSGQVLDNLIYFGAPYDIKPLVDGFVVADYAVGRLTKVADDAVHTRTTLAWGFDGPVGLAEAGKGAFYVSEYDSGKITRVETATNTRTPIIEGLDKPEGIAVTGDGRIVVAETGAHRVLAVTPATGTAESLADHLAIGMSGAGSGPFLMTGVVVDQDGAIYVTSDVDNVIYRLTPP